MVIDKSWLSGTICIIEGTIKLQYTAVALIYTNIYETRVADTQNSSSSTSASRARVRAEITTGAAFASSNLLWYRPPCTSVDTAYKHWIYSGWDKSTNTWMCIRACPCTYTLLYVRDIVPSVARRLQDFRAHYARFQWINSRDSIVCEKLPNKDLSRVLMS